MSGCGGYAMAFDEDFKKMFIFDLVARIYSRVLDVPKHLKKGFYSVTDFSELPDSSSVIMGIMANISQPGKRPATIAFSVFLDLKKGKHIN